MSTGKHMRKHSRVGSDQVQPPRSVGEKTIRSAKHAMGKGWYGALVLLACMVAVLGGLWIVPSFVSEAGPDTSIVSEATRRGSACLARIADQALSPFSGWVEGSDGALRYYDPKTHALHKGWHDEGGDRFFLDETTGQASIGWKEIEGKRYWFSDGSSGRVGAMATNRWLDEGDKTYHLSASGAADVGWVDIDEQRHYFDADGAMVTGWVHDGEKSYWIKPEDGTLANHEWIEIDGVYQAFDDDGSWVTLGEVIPPNDAENIANMSERQWAVVNACDTTPWPGKALCAGWVSDVFVNAGEGAVPGDACDLANAWCVSDDLSELKPGMIIAVASHPRTENGMIWGHVCIYIGDGLIRDSGSYGIRKSSLGSWLAWFGASETPKWGWANGVDLQN